MLCGLHCSVLWINFVNLEIWNKFWFVIILVIWVRISFRVQLWAWETVKIIFCNSVFLFSLPILFWVLSVPHICWECQMTAGCSAVGGAKHCGWGCWLFCGHGCWRVWGWGHWIFCNWGCWAFCGCGYWGWRCWKLCGWGYCAFWGIILGGFCKFPSQSSSCSSSCLHMGQCGPHVQFFAACLGASIALGMAATWGGASVFMVGADVGTGVEGIGQSFLVSNRFSEVDPVLGQRVPHLTGALGMSSKGGGFWAEGCPPFWGLAVGLEASAHCPVACLSTVTGMAVEVNSVVCIWVDVAAVVVGTGWSRTLTLYPLLAITVLFLLSLTFGLSAFLTLELVLGWTGHDCVCCGWFCVDWVWDWDLGFGPSLPSNSR